MQASLIEAMQQGLQNLVGSSSGYIESLPASVRSRLDYLDNLQSDYDTAEEALNEEIKALEKKYKPVFDKLTDLRRQVVTGALEAPEEFKVEEEGEEGEQAEDVSGIPDFWLVALCNCELIEELISQKDAEILGSLVDVRCEDILDEDGDEEGYKLTFEFADQEFFSNKELTLKICASTENGMLNVDELEGTEIKWKSDAKNPTIKVMKKKQKPGAKGKPATKKEPVDSFFNLFSPPDITDMEDMDEEDAEEMQEVIEKTLAIGEFLREDLIPHAVHWFTGEAIGDDDDEDDDDDDESDSGDDESDSGDDESDEESDDDGENPEAKVPVDAENPECKQQ